MNSKVPSERICARQNLPLNMDSLQMMDPLCFRVLLDWMRSVFSRDTSALNVVLLNVISR